MRNIPSLISMNKDFLSMQEVRPRSVASEEVEANKAILHSAMSNFFSPGVSLFLLLGAFQGSWLHHEQLLLPSINCEASQGRQEGNELERYGGRWGRRWSEKWWRKRSTETREVREPDQLGGGSRLGGDLLHPHRAAGRPVLGSLWSCSCCTL